MKERIKIAIFGLSLNVLESIKQKVRLLYDDTLEVNWANIADPHLDILLVNDMFFGSPTIQNLVGSQQVPYLRLINKNEKSGSIEGDKLYLPFLPTDEIRSWFKDRYHHVPMSQKTERFVSQIAKTVDLNKISQEFFNERNGNLQIFDGHGNMGLMNTRTEQVWIDSERKIQGTDSTLNYTYATMQMAQTASMKQGTDLRSWLWNIFWFSENLGKDHSVSTFYKLQYWPQPNSIQDRQHIFKIAACFEKGANISQVEKRLDLSVQNIQKFVSTALLTNALKEIPESEAKLVQEEVKPSDNSSGLRGFFGKLRRKLGL
ncbi:hypothetical protein [Acinetobacter sp. ANC 3832]|uniref:hypothetical protein n=1 Tax=Acinetobacter sp. ANC 3832 TaxID=1977874 RepID=UPI000A35A92A|nr:hypothetical protein [Acinetobacter sp. ANC 3832]OTG89218.1 hypothetical protein B9T35_16615 [Acinetobacter sp. ANC 3832]